MPEAVDSNSTRMPEGQRQPSAFDLLTALEDTATAFHALGELAARQLDDVDDRLSSGFSYLFRREVEELRDIHTGLHQLQRALHVADWTSADMAEAVAAVVEPSEETEAVSRDAWPEYWDMVRDTTLHVLRRAGVSLPDEDDFALWSDEHMETLNRFTAENFGQVMAMLDGSRNAFEAGGLLPWLELKFMRKFGMEPSGDLAATLAIERSSVQRIMDRLTTREDQARNVS